MSMLSLRLLWHGFPASEIYIIYSSRACLMVTWSWCLVGLGALVETTPFDHRVVDSNPALAAKYGPLASPSLTVACSASACKLRHSVNYCGRERASERFRL